MPAIRIATLTASALLLIALAPGPALAANCADEAVTARGEPGRFEVLAKAKARGNWRAKVRAMPGLGSAYADWRKAWAGYYRCSQKGGRYVCIAVAHPCRD